MWTSDAPTEAEFGVGFMFWVVGVVGDESRDGEGSGGCGCGGGDLTNICMTFELAIICECILFELTWIVFGLLAFPPPTPPDDTGFMKSLC